MKTVRSSLLSQKSFRHGDTIIEVVFAITIFSSVAVIAIASMNEGLNYSQHALEMTMARNAMDAQAEALRFIHNNFVAERELADNSRQFTALWHGITKRAWQYPTSASGVEPLDARDHFNLNNMESCEAIYGQSGLGADGGNQFTKTYSPFAVNPRFLQARGVASATSETMEKYETVAVPNIILAPDFSDDAATSGPIETAGTVFQPAPLYPRLTYDFLVLPEVQIEDTSSVHSDGNTSEYSLSEERGAGSFMRHARTVDGLWVVGVASKPTAHHGSLVEQPDYYDFYIRTCWNAAGTKHFSTLSTVVRLYNPEVVE